MTSVKNESHQYQPSPRRLQQSPNVTILVNRTMHPADGDFIIISEMIIEIDMENDATTNTSRVLDSIYSISGSALPLKSTLSTTESPPTSSI